MKLIIIDCLQSGVANVTTSALHISNENKASKIVIDFKKSGYCEANKWCDIITSEGTSLRYDLGVDEVVSFDLENLLTIKGLLTITPFIMDNDRKIKFIPNQDIVIRYQPDAGDDEAVARDDYIFTLNEKVDGLVESIDKLEKNIDGGYFI